MSIHQHPVGQLLAWLACGGRLTSDDLAELPIGDDDRRAVETQIRSAAKRITAARADGARGEARAIARKVAAELVDRAGEPLPERADDDEPTDPRALAARIPRSCW